MPDLRWFILNWDYYYFGDKPPHISWVELDQTSINLNTPWQTVQLTATVMPPDTIDSYTLNWSSSNTSVATVSQTWLVTCVTPWDATITVTTTPWNFTATCTVIWYYTDTWDFSDWTWATSDFDVWSGMSITSDWIAWWTWYGWKKILDGGNFKKITLTSVWMVPSWWNAWCCWISQTANTTNNMASLTKAIWERQQDYSSGSYRPKQLVRWWTVVKEVQNYKWNSVRTFTITYDLTNWNYTLVLDWTEIWTWTDSSYSTVAWWFSTWPIYVWVTREASWWYCKSITYKIE